jgi:hypothetical protein
MSIAPVLTAASKPSYSLPLCTQTSEKPQTEQQKINTETVINSINENTSVEDFLATVDKVNKNAQPCDQYRIELGDWPTDDDQIQATGRQQAAGNNALHQAVEKKNIRLIRYLGKTHPLLLEVTDLHNNTALRFSAGETCLEVVDALLLLNANPNLSYRLNANTVLSPLMKTVHQIDNSRIMQKQEQYRVMATHFLSIYTTIAESLIMAGGIWADRNTWTSCLPIHDEMVERVQQTIAARRTALATMEQTDVDLQRFFLRDIWMIIIDYDTPSWQRIEELQKASLAPAPEPAANNAKG